MTEEVLNARLEDPKRRAPRRAECAARVALAKKCRGECILETSVCSERIRKRYSTIGEASLGHTTSTWKARRRTRIHLELMMMQKMQPSRMQAKQTRTIIRPLPISPTVTFTGLVSLRVKPSSTSTCTYHRLVTALRPRISSRLNPGPGPKRT